MENAIAVKLHLPKTQPRYCIECACKRYKASNREELKKHLVSHNIAFSDLTEEDDEELFGKICTSCHAPLSDWLQCRFCGDVWWNGIESHMCSDPTLARKMRRSDNWLVEHFTKDVI